MDTSFSFCLSGLTLGLAAGIAPGPLTALVIAETLRHGRGAGLRVAVAPLLTDLPIVIVSVGLLSLLARVEVFLGGVSMVGAGFVTWLGWQSLTAMETPGEGDAAPPRSLRKGVATNFLNPHPYLFWLSVGAPLTVRAWEAGRWTAAAGFIGGFYLCLVGMKVVLAALVDRSRGALRGRGYQWANRLMGLALIVLALLLFRDGLRFWGMGGGGAG